MQNQKFSLRRKSFTGYLPNKQAIMLLTVNLRSFKQVIRYNKRRMKRFLTMLEKKPPRGLDKLILEADKSIWEKTDCLH